MFEQTLAIELRLSIDGKETQIPGGNIKGCTLALDPHGFRGSVSFWQDATTYAKDAAAAEALFSSLLGNAPIALQLTITRPEDDRPLVPIKLHALVTERSILESELRQASDQPVVLRECSLRFVDAASLLWREHRPLLLSANAKVADLVSGQSVGGIGVMVDLADAKTERPMVCIPTGDGPTSFYDFVLWYADRFGACFAHDYWAAQAHRYVLTETRPSFASKTRLELRDRPTFAIDCAAPRRHTSRLVNVHSEAKGAFTKVERGAAVADVVRDRPIRTPAASEVTSDKDTEAKRWPAPQPELELELGAYPAIPLMPGAEVGFEDAQFSKKVWVSGKTFRVVELALTAEAATGVSEHADGLRRLYHTTLRMRWECAGDTGDRRARLPHFTAPVWPLYVEGNVLASGADPGDRFVTPIEDKNQGLSFYEVFVPAWNQKVRVPFGPGFLPGHFFAPAYQGQRVLLALHFDRAEIAQFLDWGPDVRLPADSQSNHLLFGKNQSSQTALKHSYVDGKPVLSIERTADADRGRLQLEDGNLVLEVKEDTAAQTTHEEHSLVLEQELAQAEVQSKSEESIGKMKASAQTSSQALGGKLDGMQANLRGAIEGLQRQLGGQIEAAKGELRAPQSNLEAKEAEMETHMNGLLADLNGAR